ncbi:MAG: hypothetical protein Q7K35_02805 [bacterium]|nr:hypothetical protein [bacterium]
MRNKINILAAALGLLVFTGCVGPLYTKESQHPKGHGFGLFGSGSASQAEVNRLAIEKLKAQPVMTGTMTATGVVANATPASAIGKTAPAGYKGIVVNMSSYRRYTFLIQGPENKSFYLGPGERAPDSASYLLPGRYIASIYYGGSLVGRPDAFTVGVQEKFFQGPCHWYVVAEW